MKSKTSLPASYRLAVTSRVLAAVIGGYLMASLAAICLAHGLPAGPALSMFAAGRLAGWLAHALEQQALGGLIRPRASYTGLQPEADADVAHD